MFKPEFHDAWWNATTKNGIRPEDVEDKPLFKDRLNDIQNIINEAQMIIGFNSNAFDLPILKRCGVAISSAVETFDVMLAYKSLKKLKHNAKLITCAKYYKFKWEEEPHIALGDVKATLHCYKEMIKWFIYRSKFNNLSVDISTDIIV